MSVEKTEVCIELDFSEINLRVGVVRGSLIAVSHHWLTEHLILRRPEPIGLIWILTQIITEIKALAHLPRLWSFHCNFRLPFTDELSRDKLCLAVIMFLIVCEHCFWTNNFVEVNQFRDWWHIMFVLSNHPLSHYALDLVTYFRLAYLRQGALLHFDKCFILRLDPLNLIV